jgi:hypothetical protein
VGDGSRTRFWSDVWCGGLPLKDMFLEFYSITWDKEAFVAKHLRIRNDKIHWEMDFIRSINDWELESISNFFELLYSASIKDQEQDQICWKPLGSKAFQVRSNYHVLSSKEGVLFPWKCVWKPRVPPRVTFFIWTVALGRILTADNLRQRNIILVDWCCLCKEDGENIDNLFLHCTVARELWNSVFILFGMSWVMPRRVVDLLTCWQGSLGHHREIWKAITMFLEFYSITQDKEAFVAKYLRIRNDKIHWEIDFIHSINDWELESISNFFELLYSASIKGQGQDQICWKPSGSKAFQVRSYYHVLSSKEEVLFPWKCVWKPRVLPRVTFFIWTVALGRILTADNLRRRNIILVDWCCLCKEDGENIDHLFLHCTVARELWNSVFILFGMSWVMPRRVVDLLTCWQGSLGHHREIWKAIPHCLMWCLWRERNARTFKDSERNILDLKLFFYRSLYGWMRATGLFSFTSFLEFFLSLPFVILGSSSIRPVYFLPLFDQ